MAGGKFAGGNGTALNPFLIEDAHDFNAMRLYSSGYFFQLVKDINLNTPPYNTGTGWQPIPSFTSQIDGQGHRVTGLRIWSKGDAVGLFLHTNRNTRITNLHFDDIYLELITTAPDTKKFTLFGYSDSTYDTTESFNLLQGCTVVGKFHVDAPSVNARLLVYSITASGRYSYSSGYHRVHFVDCYFDAESVGPKPVNLFGYADGVNGSQHGVIHADNSLIRALGNIVGHEEKFAGSFSSYNAYLVDDVDTNFESFNTNYFVKQTVSFLSEPGNLPTFVAASYLGRQTWYFPGSTHARMVDYSRNKFLIEAAGQIFTYDAASGGLVNIGVSPVIVNMFTDYGMDYIESVPVSAWNDLRQTYGMVDIHCYVEKIPGKSLVTNREAMTFNQALDTKVVMKAIIDFSLHNNDINKIRIPATDGSQPVTTEPVVDPAPTDPGTTDPTI